MSIYKRRYSRDTLTGGTKDVNPQYFTMTAVMSGNDTTTTTQFPIPIQRLPQGGRAQVMEVLKVYWYASAITVTEIDASLIAFLTTKNFGSTAINYNESTIIDGFRRDIRLTTSGMYVADNPVIHDLTDNQGHGVLVASDNMYIQLQSSGTSSTNTTYVKCLYRWKDVSVQEYVGIVQSQQ